MEEKLVKDEDGRYRLTNAGSILARRLVPLIRTFRDPAHPPESSMVLSRRYHEYESGMNSILLSGHALTILYSLREGPLSRDALRDLTGARSTTLRTRIRLLTGSGHLREDENGFSLTPPGGEVAEEVHHFLRTIALLSRQKDFWNEHDISMLPDFAIDTVYRLADVEVNVDTPGNISANRLQYFDCIAKARWIAGISDWTSPDLQEVYSAEVMTGKPIRLLFPPEIIAVMYQEPYVENMQYYFSYPNLEIWVPDRPFGFALTLTDSLFILKLYAKDGVSFTNARLRAFHMEEATRWGLEVFEYRQAQAKKLERYLAENPDISFRPAPDH